MRTRASRPRLVSRLWAAELALGRDQARRVVDVARVVAARRREQRAQAHQAVLVERIAVGRERLVRPRVGVARDLAALRLQAALRAALAVDVLAGAREDGRVEVGRRLAAR